MTKAKLKVEYAPMEAKLVTSLPEGSDWQFEPKWDGFRCIAHRDDKSIDLRSKSGQPLARYFPEVLQALYKLEAKHFVIDGELVIRKGHGFSFDDLLQRIHPAENRIHKLAIETPATYILFDMLSTDDEEVIVDKPLTERRAELQKFADKYLKDSKSIILTPVADSVEAAESWLNQQNSFIDGIIAKRTDLAYQSGNRKGMLKIKRKRTADCVVGGFRYASGANEVGSLLLGLYDKNGDLHHVGFTSAFKGVDKVKLTAELEELIADKSFTVNIPGAPSRWSTERSAAWKPVKPIRVVEVSYDHVTGGRFRHGTGLLRWRPDKDPRQCTFEQIEPAGS